jgi:hypothetical protein
MPGGGPGFSAPQAPPAACQQLLTLKTEVEKNALAIKTANDRRATPPEACRLFRTFIGNEGKLIKGLEENSAACGVPPEAVKQMKMGHGQASQIAKQVCDAAARGPAAGGAPSLSDALGTTPTLPDTTGSSKAGRMNPFDTLTGNVLSR